MKTLPIKIEKKAKTYHIEMNVDRFERVAAALGMFNPEFLASLERSEKEIRAGKLKRLHSLKDLR